MLDNTAFGSRYEKTDGGRIAGRIVKRYDIKMKIVTFLRENPDTYVSGETLSDKLGFSRAAVWKYIKEIREEGYVVEAAPRSGYKLKDEPDRIYGYSLAGQLETNVIGKTGEVLQYDEIGSTNDKAYELAESGAPEGTVVIASSQSKGKGRMGRKWISPKNGGLYLSVILRPPADINEVPSLTLVAALSVSRAIKALTGLDAGIKWPNDILLNGKKVCGILTEMKAQPDKVDFLVLGIGLNVDTWQKDLPDEAVSLREVTGEKVGLTRTAKCLLEEMEKDYFTFKKDGFSGLRNECRKLSLVLDRVVEVSHHGKRIKGTAIDLDEAGALIVRTEEDQRVRILSGDVVL